MLTTIVVAMIVVFIVSALLGVWQTWLTANIGNKVMGTLRVRLFTHLQAMELSFFTRTKTGVIQSRLQNDVGGVASVLTNTVSSVLGNTVTVISAFIAMLILNWQLTIIAVVLMPFMVIAQRRVGQVRARIAGKTQESLSEMTAITQETLSVSGILLSKSFTRQRSEIERYADENQNQIRLQVSQQMTGQWFFAMVNIFMSSIPAIVYLVVGLADRRRDGGCHGRHDRRVHDGAGAPAVPAHGAHARGARPADLERPVRAHLRVPRPEAGDHGCPGRAHGADRRRARAGRVRRGVVPLPRRRRRHRVRRSTT